MCSKKDPALPSPIEPTACPLAVTDPIPRYHQFGLSVICWFLKLVLDAALPMRGTVKAMVILFSESLPQLEAPCWQTGRAWLLRVGLFKLQRPKEQAGDWIYLLDHTIQLGPDKCLAIVGLRQAHLPDTPRALRCEDLEPIWIEPVRHSTKEKVQEQLEQAARRTGVPRAIVSDGGKDLLGGVQLFSAAHPETLSVYDIKHKCALVLKAHLSKDAEWENFTQWAAHLNAQVQQTALAALRPPSQRSKCRYLNVGVLTRWAARVGALMEQRPAELTAQIDWEKLDEKFQELGRYKSKVAEWQEMMEVTEQVESFIRTHGLYPGCAPELAQQIRDQLCRPAQRIREELLAHLAEQSAELREEERVWGSTEILDSVFGKLKCMEQNEGRDGFTSMLLALPALLSVTAKDVVAKALETVRTQDVTHWVHAQFGYSMAAVRQKAYAAVQT